MYVRRVIDSRLDRRNARVGRHAGVRVLAPEQLPVEHVPVGLHVQAQSFEQRQDAFLQAADNLLETEKVVVPMQVRFPLGKKQFLVFVRKTKIGPVDFFGDHPLQFAQVVQRLFGQVKLLQGLGYFFVFGILFHRTFPGYSARHIPAEKTFRVFKTRKVWGTGNGYSGWRVRLR